MVRICFQAICVNLEALFAAVTSEGLLGASLTSLYIYRQRKSANSLFARNSSSSLLEQSDIFRTKHYGHSHLESEISANFMEILAKILNLILVLILDSKIF